MLAASHYSSACCADGDRRQTSPTRERDSSVTLSSLGHGPPEPHESLTIDVEAATVYRAPAIHSGKGIAPCPTVTLTPVEHDPHVVPVLKLSSQFFISV